MDTPSNPLYAIINADFCDNREPIKPRGPVHCDGKIWAPSYSIDPHFTQQALSYVGVDFDEQGLNFYPHSSDEIRIENL